jgi:membrane-bound lytic murein transglycosylase D
MRLPEVSIAAFLLLIALSWSPAARGQESTLDEDSLFVLDFVPEYNFEHIPDASYYDIEERLSTLETTIPLHFNERVKAFVDYFAVKNRDYTRMVMARSNYFFPIFEKVLAEHGLPDELKYLAIIESGLAVKARSRVSAVGLWQFMYGTGRMHGLQIDGYVDERMDAFKSTEAACRHLSMLLKEFDGDWELALAAYNCGSGNIRKAMRRSGGKTEFWDIYRYLPRETRSYLPQFVAMLYVFNFSEEHNFYLDPRELMYPIAFDTVKVQGGFDLPTMAALLEVCPEDLEFLNPAIRHGVLPAGHRSNVVRIPSEKYEAFSLQREAILDTLAAAGKSRASQLAGQTGSIAGRDRMVHVVRSGDVLGKIAEMYRVRVNDLKEWNNLHSNLIRVGQRLVVYQHPSTTASRQLQPVAPGTTFANGTRYHIVQPGDSLWSISRAYENLTVEKLKQLNNLSSDKLQPGQKLVIG